MARNPQKLGRSHPSLPYSGTVLRRQFGIEAASQKGFSLVELMIIVAVIGILSAMAVPNMLRFIAKGHQAEAQTNIYGILQLQLVYWRDFDRYYNAQNVWTSDTLLTFSELGFTTSKSARYSYSTSSTGISNLFIMAKAKNTNIIRPNCGAIEMHTLDGVSGLYLTALGDDSGNVTAIDTDCSRAN